MSEPGSDTGDGVLSDSESEHSFVSGGEWSVGSDADIDVSRALTISSSNDSTTGSESPGSWSGETDSSLYRDFDEEDDLPDLKDMSDIEVEPRSDSPPNPSSLDEEEEDLEQDNTAAAAANAEEAEIVVVSEGSEPDSSGTEPDAPEEEGWPPYEELIASHWYAPMREDLLVIANFYQDDFMNSFEGHSDGAEHRKQILKCISCYVNAWCPPKVHKTPEQCKRKLDKLRGLAKDKVTDFTRRLNESGAKPIKDKYRLTKTHKMANDLSGDHAVTGIPGTRESSVYPRWSEKRRKHSGRDIYKYHRRGRPDYAKLVAEKRAKLKEEMLAGVRGRTKQKAMEAKYKPQEEKGDGWESSSDEEVGNDGMTAAERQYWKDAVAKNQRKPRGGRGGGRGEGRGGGRGRGRGKRK